LNKTIPSLLQNLDKRLWKGQVEKLIGNTPLYDFSFLSPRPQVKVGAKLEWLQLGGSVKARPAFYILKNALEKNLISPQKALLDATSGNTGIAYATLGRILGIPVTLCVPENISLERKLILQTLGVNLVFTSKFEGTDGAQAVARELYEAEPEKYYLADQYANSANWQAHYQTTGPEIWRQTSETVTHFVCGLGTTGSFTGISKYLKRQNPKIKTIALQPSLAMHGLEGWKHLETAKIPPIFDSQAVDEWITLDTPEVFQNIKQLGRKTGFFMSPSAAANLLGALKLAEKLEEAVVVTLLADSGERYFETLQPILKN
jgi:cysteine synthase B